MPTSEQKARGEDPQARRRDKAFDRAGETVKILDKVAAGHTYGGYFILSIKFRFAGDPMSESLAVITAEDSEGLPVVAFHSSVGFAELFVGLVARLQNGTLKWRTDEFRS